MHACTVGPLAPVGLPTRRAALPPSSVARVDLHAQSLVRRRLAKLSSTSHALTFVLQAQWKQVITDHRAHRKQHRHRQAQLRELEHLEVGTCS